MRGTGRIFWFTIINRRIADETPASMGNECPEKDRIEGNRSGKRTLLCNAKYMSIFVLYRQILRGKTAMLRNDGSRKTREVEILLNKFAGAGSNPLQYKVCIERLGL
jgi:hypothetical protein